MRNLLEFIQRFNYWLLFVFLEVVSIVLLFRYNSYQGSVWFSSSNAISGKLFEWNSKVTAFFDLTSINEELTSRNVELEMQLAEANKKLQSYTGDSTSIAKKMNIEQYSLIEAKVISQTINKSDNLITIDKGDNDGVKKDMAVVCGNGIVGIVYLVSGNYAVVLPVLNSQSNISCTIRDRGYFGFLHWDGGDIRIANLDEIPRHARFKPGDIIETSGYSSVFPPGLAIGKVKKVFNNADGTSYRVQTELFTDFSKLRDVCVIDNTKMNEQATLIRAAQDSISIKENK